MNGIARKWLLSAGWSWAKGPQFAQVRPSNVICIAQARQRKAAQSNFGRTNRRTRK